MFGCLSVAYVFGLIWFLFLFTCVCDVVGVLCCVVVCLGFMIDLIDLAFCCWIGVWF